MYILRNFISFMLLKDYYGILEIKSSATLPEIKQAYRRLAQQYHPDKNHQDPYATSQFEEIKEAYEVLTNPAKKQHYLQQRWYDQSVGRRKSQPVITPVSVLKQALELEKYVSRLDHFRMDKQGLQVYILELVNNDTIEKLNSFNEESANDTIVTMLLHCLEPLDYPLALPVVQQLGKLNTSPVIQKNLSDDIQAKKKNHRGWRYKIWMTVLLVIIFCLIVFLLGNSNSQF